MIKRQPITCRREELWHQAREATVKMMAKKSRMTVAERHKQRTGEEVGTHGGEWGRMQVRQWLGISEEAEVERPMEEKEVIGAFLAAEGVRRAV